MPTLNENDKALLGSCMDEIRSVVGDISERQMVETIMKHKFDCAKALDDILNSSSSSATISTPAVPHKQPIETGKYHMPRPTSLHCYRFVSLLIAFISIFFFFFFFSSSLQSFHRM